MTPAKILLAICLVESGLESDPKCYSTDCKSGESVGVCQVQKTTAAWLGWDGSEDLKDPAVNVKYASLKLERCFSSWRNWKHRIYCYNGFTGTETPKNRAYLRSVMSALKKMESKNESRYLSADGYRPQIEKKHSESTGGRLRP